jgi:hypothetical protein
MTSHHTPYQSDYTKPEDTGEMPDEYGATVVRACTDEELDGLTPCVSIESFNKNEVLLNTDPTNRFINWLTAPELGNVYWVHSYNSAMYKVGVPSDVVLKRGVRDHMLSCGAFLLTRHILESAVFDKLHVVFRCMHVRVGLFDARTDLQYSYNRETVDRLANKTFVFKFLVFFRYGNHVGCCQAGCHRVFESEKGPVSSSADFSQFSPLGMYVLKNFSGHLLFSTSVELTVGDTRTYADVVDRVRDRAYEFVGISQAVLPGLAKLLCVYKPSPNVLEVGDRLFPPLVVGFELDYYSTGGKLASLELCKIELDDPLVFPNSLVAFAPSIARAVAISRRRLTRWASELRAGQYRPGSIRFWRPLSLNELRRIALVGLSEYLGTVSKERAKQGGDGETHTCVKCFDVNGKYMDAVVECELAQVVNNSSTVLSANSDVRRFLSYTYENCPLMVLDVYVEFREFAFDFAATF